MKRFRKINKTASTLVLATAVGLGSLTPNFADAQAAGNGTQERIRLIASALQARENGDLAGAKKTLEQLIAIKPDDANVQRLLAQVNKDIERQNAGEQTVFGRAAAETSFDPKTAAAAPAAAETPAAGETAAEEPSAPSRSELMKQADAALDSNDTALATTISNQYEAAYGSDRSLARLRREIESVRNNPWLQNPETLSPGYEADQKAVKSLLVKARAQMLYGDIDGAKSTLREVETRSPSNAEAKALQVEILSQSKRTDWLDRAKTRDEMLQEVSRSWQRPQVFQSDRGPEVTTEDSAVREKLRQIDIPSVELSNVPLTRAIETLSELSVIYDSTTKNDRDKGVNMLAMLGGGANPTVTLKLRHRNLETILDFLTQQVGFQWDIQNDTVVVQRSGDRGDGSYVETDFFPISRGTIIRITGRSESSGSSAPASSNPFAQAPAAGASSSSGDSNEDAIKNFFQRAGIPFEGIPGASLAFDGTQLIVTQTPRNLERMRTILRRYDQPKQVEIEARFLEVEQGKLDELGFNWAVSRNGSKIAGFGASSNRSLAGAFGINPSESQISISRTTYGQSRVTDPATGIITDTLLPIADNSAVSMAPPSIPGSIGTGQDVGRFALDAVGAAGTVLGSMTGMGGVMGIIGGVELGMTIDALSRETGSDLLSSPKVTVLSGRTAKIVIAQELRYPESYGDIEADVSTGDSGGSSVAITAGTPQDFVMRNVGVEMEVTPTVEENQNISLNLEPRVTEFEGFVEYGGPSVAIGGDGTTVIVPSGFYQPIFSTRTVRTEVTVFDGATVVLGGLTREEVKTVNDKIPLLGDIPLLGRLFQSKGESRAKRNLLIFVTANLISPGGSPSRQEDLSNVKANSLFQNPIIVTPAGGVNRKATGN